MLFTQERHQWYQYVLLMLFCFCLPLHQRLATGVILLLVLNWLMSGNFTEKFRALRHPLPLLFISFYGVHLMGLSYTHFVPEALQNLERKLSLLLFPLLLFSSSPLTKHQIKNLLKGFVLSCLVGSLYCLASAAIVYLNTGINTFYYELLSKHLGFHPSYYALYMAFALFILLHLLNEEWSKYSLSLRGISLLASVYLFVFILMLSARMEILASLLLFPTAFLIFMSKRKQLLVGLSIMLVGLIAVATLAWNIPNTKMRIQVAIKGLFQTEQTQQQPDIRLQIWNSALEVIQEKPIVGQGTAGAFPKMMKQYQAKGITIAAKKELNTHNQYLETSLNFGVIGLVLLLINLFYPLSIAWQKGDFIYVFLLAFFALAILTENMLERQQGIIFFACFNSLLALELRAKESFTR